MQAIEGPPSPNPGRCPYRLGLHGEHGFGLNADKCSDAMGRLGKNDTASYCSSSHCTLMTCVPFGHDGRRSSFADKCILSVLSIFGIAVLISSPFVMVSIEQSPLHHFCCDLVEEMMYCGKGYRQITLHYFEFRCSLWHRHISDFLIRQLTTLSHGRLIVGSCGPL